MVSNCAGYYCAAGVGGVLNLIISNKNDCLEKLSIFGLVCTSFFPSLAKRACGLNDRSLTERGTDCAAKTRQCFSEQSFFITYQIQTPLWRGYAGCFLIHANFMEEAHRLYTKLEYRF